MNARSLVGMTMSARKRAARTEVIVHRFRRKKLKLTWFHAAMRDGATRTPRESTEKYMQARAKYLIGSRLRPCRGCARCLPGFLAGAWEDCNGNGVLLAKPKKVRR